MGGCFVPIISRPGVGAIFACEVAFPHAGAAHESGDHRGTDLRSSSGGSGGSSSSSSISSNVAKPCGCPGPGVASAGSGDRHREGHVSEVQRVSEAVCDDNYSSCNPAGAAAAAVSHIEQAAAAAVDDDMAALLALIGGVDVASAKPVELPGRGAPGTAPAAASSSSDPVASSSDSHCAADMPCVGQPGRPGPAAAAATAAGEAAVAVAETAPIARTRVLVVDDDALVTVVARGVWQRETLPVLCACARACTVCACARCARNASASSCRITPGLPLSRCLPAQR